MYSPAGLETVRMNDPPRQPYYRRPVYRLVTGALGLLLLSAPLYAAFAQPSTAPHLLAALAIGVAGGNILWAACMGRESWLARIGPLR